MRRNDAAPAATARNLTHIQQPFAYGMTVGSHTAAAPRPARALAAGVVAFAAIRAAGQRAGWEPAAPRPADHVILVRGMPVAPWMRLRPMEDVWVAWLNGLRVLWRTWPFAGEAALEDQRWEVWRASHVHSVQFRRALPGSERLAELLASPRLADVETHLVGHSVGGAAVLSYLTGVRAGRLPAPRARLRAAITLDAALSGVAGVWSGARALARRGSDERLEDLGAWARHHAVNLLTISNERDVWSHRATADLPYVGLKLGPPLDLGAQVNGALHGWLRRMPEVVEALWPGAAPARAREGVEE
ncbi:MAG TPA: hypothetical protein VID73_07335 [Ktedonobacterales bacterium]|jgi:hypothetical protein